jgi:hypothetical protein
MMNDWLYKPGQSGNPAGKPKGTKNRKTLLREELEKDGSALAAALKAKALEGDPTCLGLWLARLEPVMRPRAEPVEFALDTAAPPAKQIAQVIEAVAAGDLTVDEGQQIANMLRQLAEVRALENGGDDKADKLIEAFKQMAQSEMVRG